MIITWYGHSCFKVEGEQASVIFDPFEPGYVPGFALPPLYADYCFCSHDHGDHSYSDGVQTPSDPPAMEWHVVDTFHDDRHGALRGKNRITVVEIDGMRIAHMGDIGHVLSRDQIREVGPVDILLIPVGGHFTVDAPTAKQIADAISPTITIPMHFRGEGFGFDVIAPVDSFTTLCDSVLILSESSLDPDTITGPATVVLKPPVTR